MHEYLRDTDTQFLLHIQLYYTVSRSERMLLLNKNRVISLVVNFIFLIILISSSVQADERNINKLLNNQVVVSRQIMCILGKSECDQLGLQLKGNKHIRLMFVQIQHHFKSKVLFKFFAIW